MKRVGTPQRQRAMAADCDVLVNLSASPYRRGRPAERVEQAAALARRIGVPVAVVNAVGGRTS